MRHVTPNGGVEKFVLYLQLFFQKRNMFCDGGYFIPFPTFLPHLKSIIIYFLFVCPELSTDNNLCSMVNDGILNFSHMIYWNNKI